MGERRAVAGFISGGEHSIRRVASHFWYDSNRSRGGRQASTARMQVGVQEKQLVHHLWVLC